MFNWTEDQKEQVKQAEVDLPEIDGSDGIDPLEAFMDNIDAEETAPHHGLGMNSLDIADGDDDEETPAEMMNRISRTSPGIVMKSSVQNSDDDEKGVSHPKRSIEGLAPVDHSLITYAPFNKDFYKEHGSITTLSTEAVSELRKSMGISVTGSQIARCVCSFAHLNLPESLMSVIRYHEFTAPTPIQSQVIPCALSGRDVLGIAMTGSGKTLSYVIPAVVHVLGNEQTKSPRIAVVCPTRELAIQIEEEFYRFVKKSKDQFRSVALTGGLSKYEQFQALLKGCDVVVGNPGRIIDLLQMKNGLDLSGVTFCVVDEMDRLFSMGFESQLRTIVQRIRPDAQRVMLSATMPPKVERMAREIMNDPIRVVVGSIGQASTVIDQNVFIAHSDDEKYVWLAGFLPPLLSKGGKTLIFVNTKTAADEVMRRARQILPAGRIAITCLHGDLDQSERMKVMNDFKSGKAPILVATDVAARGLDVPGVTCVIEFDAAKNFDTHIHRIGRTGRAGLRGASWTILSPDQSRLACQIVESIEALGQQTVPEGLMSLAMQHAPFRKSREAEKSHKTEEDADGKEIASWEPIEQHFKKGRSESLDLN
jgi:ATP-dependent RNA helicase DDX42